MVKAMFGAIREVNASGTSVLLVEQNVAMALDIADARVSARGRPDRRPKARPSEVFDNPALRRAYLGAAPAP